MKARPHIFLFVIILAGLSIRLYFFSGMMGDDDMRHVYHAHFLFQPDEVKHAEVVFPDSTVYQRMGVNLPLWLSMRIFGVREWALALVPLLSSLAGLLFSYALLETLAGRAAGVMGAAVWAALPADAYFATVWLQDCQYMSLLALFMLCMVKASERCRHAGWVALAGGLALGYMQYVKESAFLLLFPCFLWALYNTIKSKRIHRHGAILLIGFLIVQAAFGLLFLHLKGDYFAFWRAHYAKFVYVRSSSGFEPLAYWDSVAVIWSRVFEQWILGYAVLLLPVTILATFFNPKGKQRLFIALICASQLLILREAVKWTPGQQRYMLQLSVPFVLITILGLSFVLTALPTRFVRLLNPAVLVGLFIATAAALDPVDQMYGRERAACLRQAFDYLKDNAGEHETIYIPFKATYLHRALYQLSGFEPFKSGFADLKHAREARAGWVVLSRMARCKNPREFNIADNWLEVHRAWNRRDWVRVFKILPHEPPDYVTITHSQPDVSEIEFDGIDLGEAANNYGKHRIGDHERVRVSVQSNGLHCEFDSTTDVKLGRYAGIRLPVAGARALRIRASFPKPEIIKSIYLDCQDEEGGLLTRWRWYATGPRWIPVKTQTFVFVPGMASGPFEFMEEHCPKGVAFDALAMRTRYVKFFILAEENGHAEFVLHRLEVASPPPDKSPGVQTK